MELKINDYQLPEAIKWNYQEIKQELEEKVSMYTNLVYTDDQIKLAKADRAKLNKLKTALNDERIRREKEYLEPFNKFKAQVKDLITIIDKPVALIDKQIKAYEEQKKEEKKVELEKIFEALEKPEWLKFEQLFTNRWLQSSVSLKAAKDSMEMTLGYISKDMQTLQNLPEFGFEAQQVYISTLNINEAISEAQRMAQIQKQKQEHEAELARQKELESQKEPAQATPEATQPIPEFEDDLEPIEERKGDEKQWIAFKAYLTASDAAALKVFFKTRNIEFKPV